MIRNIILQGIILVIFAHTIKSQVLFTENFSYPAGDSIGAHGWVWNTGTTNTILVATPGLVFSGYVLSGVGNSCRLKNNGNDAYKPLSAPDSTSSMFASFMVRVDSGKTQGDYFFALLPSNSATNYMARFYVRESTPGLLTFGLSKGAVPPDSVTWRLGAFFRNVVYLVIIKYTFVPGTSLNDTLKCFIFPTGASIPGTEPSPTIGPITGSSPDMTNIGRVALLQGNPANAPTLLIDGIRLFKTWGNLVSVTQIGNTKPADFSLAHNFPNPFNPYTKIRFNIPGHSAGKIFTRLVIYDMLGNELERPVNGVLSPGSYEIEWNGTDFASGIYFYTLSSGIYRETKKMILIK